MAAERIGIATLGAGGIAGAHLKVLGNIAEGRLVAAADTDGERAKARVEEFGGERWFGSWEEALECPGVDAVIVCLPHGLHVDAVVAAARAGKHVLVEKPMANTLAEARAMVRAAEEAGVTLMVGQVLRFRAANHLARKMIREGKIGTPKRVIRRRLGWFRDWVPWAKDPKVCGGISLYGFGSHEVDMTLWLSDSHAVRVYAEGEKVNPIWGDYDDVSVQMRLSNGSMATVELSCNTKKGMGDCLVIGDEGNLWVAAESVELNGETFPAPYSASAGMEEQLREFLGAVLEKREPEASGRQVCQTTMAALEAARLALDQHVVIRTDVL